MTYSGFLVRFLLIPIILLGIIAIVDARRGRLTPAIWRAYPFWGPMLAHVVIALIYTTPWDNYLVATRVWWYDPDLVWNIILWYVPLEEYIFFMVQPIFTSLLLIALVRRLPATLAPVANPGRVRRNAALAVTAIWLVWVVVLISGWQPGTYMSLLLAWALPPVILQMAFGADILLRRWRAVVLTLAIASIFLSVADAIAIYSGTWTIDPAQSLNIYLGGILPIEEATFFFMTNVLIVLGMTLMLAPESQGRVPAPLRRLIASDAPPPTAPESA